ncbi:secretion activator protein [Sinorhizobium sp. FG01]|uniref:Secretion activator protein n=2 Tax=Sinorhizobium/Ensifer group TaxID=227292 RepID=A0A2S3YWA0_9HYPH|nr:secretion activator protein [Sinorhizobium sp. FG01]POH35895.1 secretion activator protein [Sinorhizobium americanum]
MFGHEGGYVNVKTDRGGPTKFGITHATLAAHRGKPAMTAEQVKAISREEAEDIYRRSYWTQSGGDLLPPGLDYAAFDFAVNSGPARAVKTLQKVLGVREDGQVGEQTLAAARKYEGGISTLIRAYCEARMRFLRSLTNKKTGFPVNGRGWTIRIAGKDPKGEWADQPGVIGNALRLAADASGSTVAKSETPREAGAKADSRDTGLGEVLKKPEAWGPLGGLLSAGGALFAGSGPVQWALAAAMVGAVGVGLWYFVRRVREAG